MGIFDKFNKSNNSPVLKKSIFDSEIKIDGSNYFEVFSACLGRIMTNQIVCNDIVVKNQNWNVDFSRGIISFGKSNFPVQFIGSESLSSNTWLWGWANKSQLPESVLVETYRLKSFGEANKLEAFLEPQFELDDSFNGHNLSIISAALNENNVCYYEGPHQGGSIFVQFTGIPDEVFKPISASAFSNIAMQAIQQFEVEHKIFITSFLFQNSTPYEWSQDMIIAHFDNNQDLKISFEKVEDLWRIKKIES